MKEIALSNRLAALYDGRALQGYVRWKVRTDAAYSAALAALRGRDLPLIDLGCGIGVLAFYLREHGYSASVIGIDFDQRKIDVARAAAKRYRDVDFIAGDARDPLPDGHNVVILDLLHYFDSASQQTILTHAAQAVPRGGAVIIRQPLRDRSWRYRLTKIVDALARTLRWMKAESLNYPTREEVVGPFAGFTHDIRPLYARMPFNTYFFVFTREGGSSEFLGVARRRASSEELRGTEEPRNSEELELRCPELLVVRNHECVAAFLQGHDDVLEHA